MKTPNNKVELRKAWKKLELSEKKFRAVAETATDSIIITDQNSIIIYCNSKALETFGYSIKEMTGQDLDLIIPEKYRKDHKLGVERFIKTKKPNLIGRTVEIEALKKDGTVFPIELSLSYWKEEGGIFFTGIIRDISQRKIEEQRLRENESKYRLIAENSSDVVSINKPDGTIVYISPSTKHILGYEPEELIGTNAYLLYHPEDLEQMQKAYKDALSMPDTYTVTFRCRKKNGEYIWFESLARTFRDEFNQPIEIHSTNRDVTERIVAEQSLSEARNFASKIANLTPTLISIHDLTEKRNLYTNKGLTELLGYAPEFIIGSKENAIISLFHPDDRHKVNKVLTYATQLRDNQVLENEFRVRHTEGNYRWMLGRTTVFKRNNQGEVIQTISSYIDITDRKVAEEKLRTAREELSTLNRKLEEKVNERTQELKSATENLRKSENLLRFVTNNLPAFISYIDKNLIYQFCNDYYTKLPYLDTSPVGKHMQDVLGNAYQKSEPYIQKVLLGETLTFTTSIHFKDGSEKDIEVWYIPDKDEKSELKGFIVMGMDITERLNYERTLNRKNEELQKINNDLDNFVYTASHDLKAPVSNIEGLINSLLDIFESKNALDEDVYAIMNMIQLSIKRFQGTIHELTEISKIQRNIEGDTQQLNFETIIDEVKSGIENIISETNARIQTDISSCPEIRFQSKNLKSLVYNLLTNAIKYRDPKRSPEIRIITFRKENYCVFEVTDNGLGISDDQKDKIFGMFKRGHTHMEGSGVGLYLVKRIIENAGGKVEVESKEGTGSTFRIYFPL